MSIDDDFADFHAELVDCMCELVRIASRVQMLEAQDDVKLASLLNRSEKHSA